MAKKNLRMLNGSELAGFIKQRQAKQARRFFAENGRMPKLTIFKTNDDPTITTYVNLKKRYGDDIGVEVEIIHCEQKDLEKRIQEANENNLVDAVIVQLPLQDPDETDQILTIVDKDKDVDGLNPVNSSFDSATATAILWLLAGYNIDLRGKKIAVIGQGRLVGKPIADSLEKSGNVVVRADKSTKNLQDIVSSSEIIISATGQPEVIKSTWVQSSSVVVDAGVAGEKGELRGDVEEKIYERNDLTITPKKGGLGPLTVCSLFENVLKAANILN